MHRRTLTVTTTLSLVAPFAAVALMSSDAEAATPTFYNAQPAYAAALSSSVTDDYSNAGYVFIQNNAQMSAVVGETDYQSTGFNDLNIVSGGAYCAGCNGSFRLIFTSTSQGNAQGVHGVGMNITVNAGNPQYTAFITYADGDTDNVLLPLGASYWAVTAPERIQSIHFGLPDAGTTTNGSFQIDNLQIGALPLQNETCNGAALDISTLTPGSGATVTQLGTTVGAGNDIDEDLLVACWGGSGTAEHVYQFTLAESRFLQIDLDGSLYDTKLAVVNGCPAGDIWCQYNDDFIGLDSGFVCTEYPAGSYSTIVSGFGGQTGAYTLNITECDPCGNGLIDPGEDCDDSGESATCDIDCTSATCGDGYTNVAAMETCDDSGESATCDSDCTAPSCGDGVPNMAAGEACDTAGESETCNANCTVSQCGDGITNAQAGEECDDSGESANCDDDCSAVACGDSNVNETAGETCDDGGRSPDCNADCTAASCGDGILNAAAGEECDGDGMGTPGQTATCDADCTNAMCGDGVVNDDASEECDDAGESATCNDDCTSAECGDGVVNATAGEECDDSNTDDGDGCSAACLDEEEPGTSSGEESSSGGEESSSGGEESSSGGTSDTSDDTTGGPSTDTDDPTNADTSGSASNSGTGNDEDNDTSDTNDDDGDDETSTSDTAGGTADDGGCGCTTDDRRGNGWSLLGLFGLGALVRRRRRA